MQCVKEKEKKCKKCSRGRTCQNENGLCERRIFSSEKKCSQRGRQIGKANCCIGKEEVSHIFTHTHTHENPRALSSFPLSAHTFVSQKCGHKNEHSNCSTAKDPAVRIHTSYFSVTIGEREFFRRNSFGILAAPVFVFIEQDPGRRK